MKQTIRITATLLFCLPYIAINTDAVVVGRCGTTATWELDDTGVLTISGEGVLSSPTDDLNLLNKEDVTSVIIGEGITSIKGLNFYEMPNITYVKLPNSLNVLETYVFNDCNNIESIDMPISIESIGEYAFKSCTKLSSIDVPQGCTSIGQNAFNGCSAMDLISLPNTLLTIGVGAFNDCIELTTIVIPNGVTKINRNTFYRCSKLNSITLPVGLKEIAEYSFCYCNALETIILPDSLETIGNASFKGSNNLTSITLPDKVNSLGNECFKDCSALKSVNIGSGVTNIGKDALANIHADAMINERYESLEEFIEAECEPDEENVGAFRRIRAVIAWGECGERATWELDKEGILIIEGTGRLKMPEENYNKTKIKNLIIKEGIDKLGSFVFTDHTNLVSAKLPNSLTEICGNAFSNCEKLSIVLLGNNVQYIYEDAFSGTAIEEIEIPETCLVISRNAFLNCTKLKEIVIPENILTIDMNTFNGCSSLSKVTIPQNVDMIFMGAFDGVPMNALFNGEYEGIDSFLASDFEMVEDDEIFYYQRRIKEGTTAKEQPKNRKEIITKERYDLNGMKNNNGKGLSIVRTVYSDGSVESRLKN